MRGLEAGRRGLQLGVEDLERRARTARMERSEVI